MKLVVVIELKVRRNLFRTAPVKSLQIWRKVSPPLIKKKKKKKKMKIKKKKKKKKKKMKIKIKKMKLLIGFLAIFI